MMDKTTHKRVDVWLRNETYNQILKLNSLRIAAEKKNISVTKTISDLIDQAFKKTIG